MVTSIQKLQPWIWLNTPTARGGFRQRDTPHRRGARAAVGTGDLQGLLDVLAPDVVPLTDGRRLRWPAGRPTPVGAHGEA